MKTSYVVLGASLLMGLGGWTLTLSTWSEATTPVAIGGLLTGLGGVVLAWLGKSPIKGGQAQ